MYRNLLNHSFRICLFILVLGLLSCTCTPEKPTLTRAWIGSQYATINPPREYKHENAIHSEKSSLLYLQAITKDSPTDKAGLQEGDILLQINDTPIFNVTSLYQVIDQLSPGETAIFHILRNGQEYKKRVKMGKETYKKWTRLMLGLRLSNQLDLLPNAHFSLFGLISYHQQDNRPSLNNAKTLATESLYTAGIPQNEKEEFSLESDNREFFFLPFGWGQYNEILTQETIQ